MRNQSLAVVSVLALGASACASEATEASDSADASQSTGADSLGSSDGSDGSDGLDGAEQSGSAPTQKEVAARVAGRSGYDVAVTLLVQDSDKDTAGIWLRALDAAGQPVIAFRSGLDPSPDTAEAKLPFDAPSAKTSFVGLVTIRNLALEYPGVAKLEVAVFDQTGQRAQVETVEVAVQEVVTLGAACDPDFVESRCDAGLGCVGTPATCDEGQAPEIKKVAYIVDDLGPRILVAGTEPEDDISNAYIEFLNAKGEPVEVDLDGDDSPDGVGFDVDATGQASNGEFFVRVLPSAAFAEMVAQVAVTLSDAAGHIGERKVVKQTKAASKGNGATCDPRGFDTCGASGVCVMNSTGTKYQCQTALKVQTQRCASAPVVDVAVGSKVIDGLASGASAWDAPRGCASADPVGRPEGVAVLKVTEALARLTLSTATAGTNFDTVIYVMDACGTKTAAALVCGDDTSEGALVSAAGTVSLELVEPGEYIVVVDSWSPEGGAWTLNITAE